MYDFSNKKQYSNKELNAILDRIESLRMLIGEPALLDELFDAVQLEVNKRETAS